MITYKEFLDKYLGKSKGYPDGKYVGECLSICKLYILECFGIDPPASGTNSAYGYWSNFPSPLSEVFEKVGNTDTLIPEKGWIAIWKPWDTNSYGHIAIVDEGCTSTKLINNAQNWTSKVFQKETNNYNNVIGFLKPKSSIIQEDMTDNEKILIGLINENGLVEGDIRWLVDLKKNQTVPNLEKKVSDLESSVKVLEEQITIINTKLGSNEKDLTVCQKDLKTANQTISNITVELETANTERSNYKKWYEVKCAELKECTSNKFNLLDFIKSLFKK